MTALNDDQIVELARELTHLAVADPEAPTFSDLDDTEVVEVYEAVLRVVAGEDSPEQFALDYPDPDEARRRSQSFEWTIAFVRDRLAKLFLTGDRAQQLMRLVVTDPAAGADVGAEIVRILARFSLEDL